MIAINIVRNVDAKPAQKGFLIMKEFAPQIAVILVRIILMIENHLAYVKKAFLFRYLKCFLLQKDNTAQRSSQMDSSAIKRKDVKNASRIVILVKMK